jgi:hypothetical protein
MTGKSYQILQWMISLGALFGLGLLAACAPIPAAAGMFATVPAPGLVEIRTPVGTPETGPTPSAAAVPSLTETVSRPVDTAVPTFTSTATVLPTVTFTSTPTVNPYDGGVLTPEQKQRLYAVSLRFLADTEPAAIKVAQHMDFLGVMGHPATMCGPLSIAILRDAGLLPADTALKPFFYMDPRISQRLLEKTFPRDRYLWYRDERVLNQIDFSAFPLFAGDFLYLYAGKGGDFEHILTVNRVDEAGRVYAVSNLYNGEGFIIQEILLYDPHQPGTGMFYDWTDWKHWKLGRTGYAGLSVWRPMQPIPSSP